MVDSPSYEPLGQGIMIEDSLEGGRRKRRDYMRDYRKKNREKLNEYQRNYWKNRRVLIKREWLFGIQKGVYDYLVEYHRKWEDAPRWTQIAKDLGMKETSVYTAIFQLIKKWYVWRWSMWRYYLTKVPEEKEITVEDIKDTIEVLNKKSSDNSEIVYVNEKDYDDLVKRNEELEEQVKNSISHIEWLMESNDTLEKKNLSLRREIEELKWVVKVLLKYFQ